MTKRAIATITVNDARGAFLRRNLGNQIDGPVLVYISFRVNKTNIAIIALFENLHKIQENTKQGYFKLTFA